MLPKKKNGFIEIESFNLDDWVKIGYYYFEQAAMVKSVDTLLLGSSARASRFESEWRHSIFEKIYKKPVNEFNL